MIDIYFFGRVSDVLKKRHLRVDVLSERDTLFFLRDRIFRDAEIAPASFMMSLNKAVVRDDVVLKAGDEVAFFSVFSGG